MNWSVLVRDVNAPSATAFVPVLCQGSSVWSDPFVLSFVLRKAGGDWLITEAVELDPNP